MKETFPIMQLSHLLAFLKIIFDSIVKMTINLLRCVFVSGQSPGNGRQYGYVKYKVLFMNMFIDKLPTKHPCLALK